LNFEQLYIENPAVEVRRDAAGKLHVAGLSMATDTTGEGRGADWFFGQREFVIRGGTVRWTDESRGAPPLLLSDVQFIARNGARSHTMRLDATPPAGWGERFMLLGAFRQPLLSVRTGNWHSWDGVAYAELPRIDIRQLGQYVTLDARIREGNGALRIWADVDDGQIAGGTADLALLSVDASLGKSLEPLVLRAVTGRLAGRMTPEALEFSTTDLQFQTPDGMRWPGGNLWFQHLPAKGRICRWTTRPARRSTTWRRAAWSSASMPAGRARWGRPRSTRRAAASAASAWRRRPPSRPRPPPRRPRRRAPPPRLRRRTQRQRQHRRPARRASAAPPSTSMPPRPAAAPP
jgi:uncharacterized protein YhdP